MQHGHPHRNRRAESRHLTEDDKRKSFLRATGGFCGARTRWAEHAERGMRDDELAEALASELGIFGGSCGPGDLTYQGAGLKIWISWENQSHVTARPTFAGKTTIEMARFVYGIKDPASRQLALF